MASFLDVCRFTPTLGGTTDWTVSTAVTGYQTPAAAGAVNGLIYRYRAESADLSQWELGYGAYTVAGTVLARTTVLFNSLGTTAKVSFSTAPQVGIVALAEDLVSIEEANAYNGLQINGSMEVSQENGTTARTTDGYICDGWRVDHTGTMVYSAAQVADAPAGLTNSLKVTISTAEASIAAGDYLIISQPIEGFRTSRLAFGVAGAQSISIGFWTKIHRTGTYSGSIQNSAQNRSYPFTFTQNVADTWEFKTVTVSGDVTGTWIGNTNGTGLILRLAMASGTTFAGTAATWAASTLFAATGTTNGVAATSDVFQITGVIILPGTELPSSSRAPLIMRPYTEELVICQRYYEKSYNSDVNPGAVTNVGMVSWNAANASATVNQRSMAFFHVTKRATPTGAVYSTNSGASGNCYNSTAAADASAIIQTIGESSLQIQNQSGTTAVNNEIRFHWSADARL